LRSERHAPTLPTLARRRRQWGVALVVGVFAVTHVRAADVVIPVSSADGRLEVFVALGRDYVKHAWQTSAGTSSGWAWADYDSGILGPDFLAGRDAGGRLFVAGIHDGGVVWWSAADAPGGALVPARSLGTHDLHSIRWAMNQDGRVELFALSSQGAVWSIRETAAGNRSFISRNLGGTQLRNFLPVAYRDGRLAIVAIGGDRGVWWASQTGPNADWNQWSTLQGRDIQDISACANADGRLEIVALGADRALYHRYQTSFDAWSEWETLGRGPFQPPINFAQNADGRLEVFVKTAGNVVVHSWQTSPNGAWNGEFVALGAAIPGSTPVQSLAHMPDRRLVMAAAENGREYPRVYVAGQREPNGGWIGWVAPPETRPTPPPPPIAITEFKAVPDYVNQGSPSTLSWKFTKDGTCGPADLVLNRKIYGEAPVTILQQPGASSPGSKEVVAAGATLVTYVLTATCRGNPSVSQTREAKVQLAPPPAQPAAYLVVDGPVVDPYLVHEKMPFRIGYTFANLGNLALDSFDVTLLVDGAAQGAAKTVPKLDPGKSATLQWDVPMGLVGYAHSADLTRGSASLSHAQFSVEP
jgi:hypothetical protein